MPHCKNANALPTRTTVDARGFFPGFKRDPARPLLAGLRLIDVEAKHLGFLRKVYWARWATDLQNSKAASTSKLMRMDRVIAFSKMIF